MDVLDDPLLTMKRIATDLGVTQRAVRKRISRGEFPPADTNISGLNFWKSSTYRRWKADALAGRYSAVRNPRAVKEPRAA